MTYRIGQMRHRVTFERSTVAANSMGDPVPSWSSLGTFYARVEHLAGKERFASQVQQHGSDYRITTRYNPDIASLDEGDRATWAGKTFDVRNVVDVEGRNKELHIFATVHSI